MPEENEYEIEGEYEVEERDTSRWFDVTRHKDDREFSIEYTYAPLSETTVDTIYNEYGEEIRSDAEEYKEISAVVSKYLEKEEDQRTIEIEVLKGVVVAVRNLPIGTRYKVIDHDLMEDEQ